MRAPIIVNNSPDMNYADLDVFATVQDAEMYNESWDINEPYFAYDADGLRLKMLPNEEDYSVIFRPIEDQPSGKAVLTKNLRDDLRSTAEIKGYEFIGVTQEWLDKATHEELLEVHLQFATK